MLIKEKNMKYHVIDSVKGGCGKSTFAIMLAAAINKYPKEDEKGNIIRDQKRPVCLFDMDLQGTSMAYLLFGKNWKNNRKLPSELDIYLNEKIGRSDVKGKRFIKKVVWGNDPDKDSGEANSDSGSESYPEFYVAVSSPIQKDKDQYKPKSSQNYSPGVSYGRFRYGLSKLLTPDNLYEELKERLEHVILDMPPNSDGYSDAVTDFLLDGKRKVLKDGDSCNYFLMVTRDLAHQQATLEWLNVFLNHEGNRDYPNKLIITLAFTPRDVNKADEDGRNYFAGWVKEFKKSLRGMSNWKEELINRIYFLAFGFNAEYYELCCEQDGIINNTVDIGNPIKYMQAFDGEMNVDSATKNFLKILCK